MSVPQPPVEMPPIAIEVTIRLYANGMMYVGTKNRPPDVIYALEAAKHHMFAGTAPAGSGAPGAEPPRLWSPGGRV